MRSEEQERIHCACHQFLGPVVYNLCMLKRTDFDAPCGFLCMVKHVKTIEAV